MLNQRREEVDNANNTWKIKRLINFLTYTKISTDKLGKKQT